MRSDDLVINTGKTAGNRFNGVKQAGDQLGQGNMVGEPGPAAKIRSIKINSAMVAKDLHQGADEFGGGKDRNIGHGFVNLGNGRRVGKFVGVLDKQSLAVG